MTAGVIEVLRNKNFLLHHVPSHLVLPLLCFILPYCCKIFRLRFANSLVLSSFKSFLKSSVLVPACWYSPLNSDCQNVFFQVHIYTLQDKELCPNLRLISFAYTHARQKSIFNSLSSEKKLSVLERPCNSLLLTYTNAWFQRVYLLFVCINCF